jgi:hypothetical protein
MRLPTLPRRPLCSSGEGFSFPIFFVIVALALLFFWTSCKKFPGTAGSILAGQTPGVATGAGGTLTGPANSATPSTQVAERRVAYFPPGAASPLATPAGKPSAVPLAPASTVPSHNAANAPVAAVSDPALSSPLSALSSTYAIPAPAWLDERVTTTIGQHQDAAPLVKLAVSAGQWPAMRWFGFAVIVFSLGALLWSAGHDQGYPVVYLKTGACGVAFLFVTSPWWLALGALPLGFYLLQKFGLFRLPLP